MSVDLTVHQLQERCRAQDVEGVLKLFAADATVCGEGAPAIVSGEAELRETIAHMFEFTPSLTISIHQQFQVVEDCVVTWLHWSSPSPQGEPIAFRSLTTWRKQGDAWTIVADFYGMGRFEA
ncbi:nuclear transport factor 2 family protein [Pseudomonas sp. NPDC008258]|uniref:YybH family protein n=1 Tax=Pseudomonas sp. NPDC008258 TaxID=3364418 RepID=UPI0036EDDCF2